VWAALCAAYARSGVTSLLATLAPARWEDLLACLDLGRAWRAAPPPGAQILGLYLESPYINPVQRGALDPAHLRLATDGSPAQLLAYHDVLRVMTIAPELPGGLDLVRDLALAGIIPAAGHSSAHDSHVRAAMALGLRHVTHLWSAMSLTVREGPWRKPGLLEAALAFPGLTGEVIADGKHLPPTLLQLAYKCLGPERLCVVSDATSGAGLPEGAHFRMGGLTYEVADGVGMMFDRSCFAGSTTLLNQMLPVLVNAAGLPLAEAVRMATETPARVLGLERKGRLAAGQDADLAIFNPDFTAWAVLIAGQWQPLGEPSHGNSR
jgi:N-acetylglucosamine-6-phosphate deacetylase